MIDQASVPSLMGSTVRDNAGEKIGKVGQVYLDDTTGQPEWVTVRTGLFGTKESFVPLAAARVEGDELIVDIAKDRVSDAPKVDEDGHLSEEQETELYQYYGVSQGPFGRQTTPVAGGGPTDSTYAGTETGRSGEGYPETDAGADYATTGRADAPATQYATTDAPDYAATDAPATQYATTDAATGAPATDYATTDYATTDTATGAPATDYGTTDAATGAPATDYATTDAATGVAGTTDYANTDAATGAARTTDRADTDAVTDVTPTGAGHETRADGPFETDRVGAVGDPTGTPVGDTDVSEAFSGPGYGDVAQPDEPEAGPDFARGEDGSVTTGEVDSGPDFARGEDTTVTREDSTVGPDFARGEDRSGAVEDATSEPPKFKSRLRRWLSSDEPAGTDDNR